ncbi:MAG: peptidyl-prolyl cis-trans isomerase [Solirubrobacteraceae bacterium]
MKSLRSILALGAFFVLLAGVVAGCGSSSSGSVPSDSVATVAGNPISTQAFKHWMYVAAAGQAAQSPGQPVIVPSDPPNFTKCIAQVRQQIPSLKKTADKTLKADCGQLFTSLSGQVMDFLIKAYWYQAEAHRLGIKITDAQVQKALNTAKKAQFSTPAQFQQFLKQSGQTQQDILFRVRVNQIFQKLTSRHPTAVTPAAIASYYNSHKSQFGSPQSRNLLVVLTKTEAAANKAKAALQSGQSWAVVAKKYSIDPSKSNGGALNGVTVGQQDAGLTKVAFAAPIGKVVGPVKTQFGYYVIKVTKINPATHRSLAQSTALIKQTLRTQRQTQAQTAVDTHAKQDWLKKTSCLKQYAMADCSGYKAPKTTSTPGAAGATPTPTPGAAGATTTAAP